MTLQELQRLQRAYLEASNRYTIALTSLGISVPPPEFLKALKAESDRAAAVYEEAWQLYQAQVRRK